MSSGGGASPQSDGMEGRSHPRETSVSRGIVQLRVVGTCYGGRLYLSWAAASGYGVLAWLDVVIFHCMPGVRVKGTFCGLCLLLVPVAAPVVSVVRSSL